MVVLQSLILPFFCSSQAVVGPGLLLRGARRQAPRLPQEGQRRHAAAPHHLASKQAKR